jgi:hypothetical protein
VGAAFVVNVFLDAHKFNARKFGTLVRGESLEMLGQSQLGQSQAELAPKPTASGGCIEIADAGTHGRAWALAALRR